MSNQSCCGLWGKVFGHKFRPRYDRSEEYPKETAKLMEIAISRVATGSGRTVMLPDDVQALDKITDGFRQISNTDDFYTGDVCERCGLQVERPPDPVEQTDTDELIEVISQRLAQSGPFQRAQMKDALRDLTKLIKAKLPVEPRPGEEDLADLEEGKEAPDAP